MLDVPYELVERVSWLIYARSPEPNWPWRRLGCFKQALLSLARLRKNETFAQLANGFGVSTATAWRYVDEPLDVLAAWAPGLHEALTRLGKDDFVIIAGTLIPIDRTATDGEPCYSQEHRKHGMNVRVITRTDGTPLQLSRATPGRTHDLTARAHSRRQFNRNRAQFRAPGEHAFALLKSWRIIRRARCSACRIGTIV